MKGQSSFYRVPLYWRPMPTIPVVNLHRLEVGSTAFQGREFFFILCNGIKCFERFDS